MECTLMHRKRPVALLEIDETSADILRIVKIFDYKHFPIGTLEEDLGEILPTSRARLNAWWSSRSIPASRENLQEVLIRLEETVASALLIKSYGLSLSDQYWISPASLDLKWEDVNFFDHDFSKDVGEILFGSEPSRKVNMVSPDNTSDGWLMKKWVINNGRRLLMKGGSGDYKQEPYNEVIASLICNELEIPYVPYWVTQHENKPYSLCETFITRDTDLVPAWRIFNAFKKQNHDSDFQHLLKSCERLGIKDARPAIEKMLTLDYIIANSDRHYNNFGFIRDAKTLEWKGFAPIYDSGTSLWHDTRFVGRLPESKPFKKSHSEQMNLVNDLEWFNAGALVNIREKCLELFSQSPFLDKERQLALSEAIERRGREMVVKKERLYAKEKSHIAKVPVKLGGSRL